MPTDAACRLYLITPAHIADLEVFASALEEALSAGDVACFQLRLKDVDDATIASAVKRLMPGFALAKNSTVTALSRRGKEKAEASAREFGIAHGFGSAEELCACPEVDAIFVTTPNFLHRNDVRLALHHGKAV
ncbi:MAG: Gfo/Idh/MocA family oxidoreductase, partial [Candidatus Binataceae bacterium]